MLYVQQARQFNLIFIADRSTLLYSNKFCVDITNIGCVICHAASSDSIKDTKEAKY